MDRYGFATGVVALAIVAFPLTWALVGPLIVAVHEVGHALTGVVSGRKVRHIKIFSRESGVTEFDRQVNVLMSVAGYLAPPFAGLAAAHGVRAGQSDLVLLAAAVVLGAALVLKIRNVFGVVAIAATVAVLWLLLARAGVEARQGLAHVLAWTLMLGGVRAAFTLYGAHIDDPTAGSDAQTLRSLTGLPVLMWMALLSGAGCYALYSGAVVLIPSWAP